MKKPIFILSLLLLFLLSYLREVTFIGLNSIIEGQEHNYANTNLPAFLYNWPSAQLLQLKWVLTIIYSVFFAALTYCGIRIALSKAAGTWVLIVYALLFAAVGLLFLSALLFLDFAAVYPLLRNVIGIVHSPLLFLLISISYYAVETLKKN